MIYNTFNKKRGTAVDMSMLCPRFMAYHAEYIFAGDHCVGSAKDEIDQVIEISGSAKSPEPEAD